MFWMGGKGKSKKKGVFVLLASGFVLMSLGIPWVFSERGMEYCLGISVLGAFLDLASH